MTGTVAGLIVLAFVLIARTFHPAPQHVNEENESETFVSPDEGMGEEEKAEESIQYLLHKAKDLLHLFQSQN